MPIKSHIRQQLQTTTGLVLGLSGFGFALIASVLLLQKNGVAISPQTLIYLVWASGFITFFGVVLTMAWHYRKVVGAWDKFHDFVAGFVSQPTNHLWIKTGQEPLDTIGIHLNTILEQNTQLRQQAQHLQTTNFQLTQQHTQVTAENSTLKSLLPVALLEITPDDHLLSLNDQVSVLLGYDPETLLKLSLDELLQPEELNLIYPHLHHLRSHQEKIQRLSLHFRHQNQNWIPTCFHAQIYLDAQQNPHILAVLEDLGHIHSLRASEEKAQRILLETRERMKHVLTRRELLEDVESNLHSLLVSTELVREKIHATPPELLLQSQTLLQPLLNPADHAILDLLSSYRSTWEQEQAAMEQELERLRAKVCHLLSEVSDVLATPQSPNATTSSASSSTSGGAQ